MQSVAPTSFRNRPRSWRPLGSSRSSHEPVWSDFGDSQRSGYEPASRISALRRSKTSWAQSTKRTPQPNSTNRPPVLAQLSPSLTHRLYEVGVLLSLFGSAALCLAGLTARRDDARRGFVSGLVAAGLLFGAGCIALIVVA